MSQERQEQEVLLFTVNKKQLWSLLLSVQINTVEPHMKTYTCSDFIFSSLERIPLV